MQTELDAYQCRHGLGYTVIDGPKDGLCVRQELLAPKGENCLLMRITAENGAVAVEKIAASRPGAYDLVLMDIQMPVMDGNEATRRIRHLARAEHASIPIIAMTANAFDEDRRAALDCGMDGFVSKPLDLKELISVLNSVLGRLPRL